MKNNNAKTEIQNVSNNAQENLMTDNNKTLCTGWVHIDPWEWGMRLAQARPWKLQLVPDESCIYLDYWLPIAVDMLAAIKYQLVNPEDPEEKSNLLCIALGMVYQAFEAALYELKPNLRESRVPYSGSRFLRTLVEMGLTNDTIVRAIEHEDWLVPVSKFHGFIPPFDNIHRKENINQGLITKQGLIEEIRLKMGCSGFSGLNLRLEQTLRHIREYTEQINMEDPEERQNLLCVVLVELYNIFENRLCVINPQLRYRRFGPRFFQGLEHLRLVNKNFESFIRKFNDFRYNYYEQEARSEVEAYAEACGED